MKTLTTKAYLSLSIFYASKHFLWKDFFSRNSLPPVSSESLDESLKWFTRALSSLSDNGMASLKAMEKEDFS